MQKSRNGIALLITLMFVIVITVAIGYGLKQVNDATKIAKQEKFIYQSSVIVEDIINILNNSQELQAAAENNSSSDFYLFLSQTAFIPFEYEGMEIVFKIKSARGKFNPSMLSSATSQYLKEYVTRYNINAQYVDILEDNIKGIKVDNSYNSTIFDENPYLFRDYIASAKHLKIINDYYTKEYHDNALKNVAFDELFYYTDDKNITIDLNYATAEVWEFMLGCSKERATLLSEAGGSYVSMENLNLNNTEKERLQKNFKISFFEPVVQVELDIRLDESYSKVNFEYDIKKKKGSNFVYEI